VVGGRPSVLVADSDSDAREFMSEMIGSLGLASEPAVSGAEALAAIARSTFALILLAVDLADPCCYEVLHRLRERSGPSQAAAVISAQDHPAPRDEVAALLLGADDYFAKPLQHDLFLARVRRLTEGGRRAQHGRLDRPPLTNREYEVLAMLVSGLRSAEIAERLCITRKTTATHIERILGKLGAHSQAQAVAFAVRDRILDPGRPSPDDYTVGTSRSR
jgi:DNA-binding NarL/FixJ family response regulator